MHVYAAYLTRWDWVWLQQNRSPPRLIIILNWKGASMQV